MARKKQELTEAKKDWVVRIYKGTNSGIPMSIGATNKMTGFSEGVVRAVLIERGVELHKGRPVR